MTKRDAFAEARRRWGPLGWVGLKRWVPSLSGPRPFMRVVGVIDPNGFIQDFGQAAIKSTWEAAFADADRREKGE